MHRAKFRERQRAEQGIHAGCDPYREEPWHRRQMTRHFTRRPQDPHSDRVADQHGDAKTDAEDLQQPTLGRCGLCRS